jgi:thioredoxin reductase (NADPH)
VEPYDCLVAGGGPAGLSAAVYMARFNRSVVFVDSWRGRWRSHEVNENYLGFPRGIASRRLRELGRRQAQLFGATYKRGKIASLRAENGAFVATIGRERLDARTVILATGVEDILPDLGQTQQYWGKSLFWCITCDGWKVRGKRVAVVGQDDEAAVSCLQLLNFTHALVFLTHAEPGGCALSSEGRTRLEASGVPVIEGRITRAEGRDGMMSRLVLDDGRRLPTRYMFSHLGCRPRVALAQQLGVKLADNGFIETDHEQRTNVPLVYAAGDVTRLFAHQIGTAVHEGATAATTANYDLYSPNQKH